jgi:flagellar M-ring protein FliF
MGLLQKINVLWEKIGVVQRAMLIAIVLACVITGSLLTKWATKADMVLLYSNLDPESAANIVDKISEKGIEYELAGGGTTIRVPQKYVYQLRLDMAKEGLLNAGNKGYQIFDNQKIGVPPLVQQLNLNRAMQDELAKTIQMIDGVQMARVHIVRPEATLFGAGEQKATAAIVLQLKPGWTLSQMSIVAITNIVANATDGLKSEDVTVANGRGDMLTSASSNNSIVAGANTFMDYKARVEQELSNKIQSMLEVVLGPGRSTVKISAVVNMENIETITKTYEKGMAVEETTNSTLKEIPPTSDADGNITDAGNTETTETSDNRYMIPETITKRSDVPGKITSVSVAALVDLAIEKPKAQPEGAEKDAAVEMETVMIMQVEDVIAVIKNAIGPELLSDDAITVKDIRFARPAAAVMAADDGVFGYEKLSRYVEIARQSSMGVLAVCALIVLKILTGGGKKVAAAEGDGGNTSMEAMSLGLLPAGASADPATAFRRHIAGELKENPEQVKQLFASWLTEEG